MKASLGLRSVILAAARKHANAIVLMIIVASGVIIGVLAYHSWQAMFGTLWVIAQTKSTFPNDYLNFDYQNVSVNVISGGSILGQSGVGIRLMPGNYTLSFPNYGDYVTPENQTVFIESGKEIVVNAFYCERKGWLTISNNYHRAIIEDIYVDNEWKYHFVGYSSAQNLFRTRVRSGTPMISEHVVGSTVGDPGFDLPRWHNYTIIMAPLGQMEIYTNPFG